MKLILPATLAVLASTAVAENCNEGFDYCALTLLKNGNYHQQILQAMDDHGKNRANWNYDNFLYHCGGGSNGDISITKDCPKGCVDGGAGNDDQCQ
ncbi:hypothetical protein P170DRAFT_469628 [Aspergillus steynii IBT 23096]|uniref:Uncharacterized protein n=1 Tax=Aspergillus steynii IBT 23096 TaxID=1392250 RepID=A0A2I2GMS2_9EURO|nr:uncharacterized protein P170DRAFT_469628 [Aspergillus steynii IBT 23096]PLB54164.1 hypothetical protein P170DRAFT_469628 [Aspergillus steynii IBT 23096]